MESYFFFKEKLKFLRCIKPLEAVAYYQNISVDLLTGEKKSIGIDDLNTKLEKTKAFELSTWPRVTHFFYEYAQTLLGERESDKQILAIDILYSDAEWIEEFEFEKVLTHLTSTDLSQEQYLQAFDQVQSHLIEGDCYQVNLTKRLEFKFDSNYKSIISSLFSQKESLGSFAHSSFIPNLNLLLISNSPECLFKLRKNKITAMPIKGTVSLEGKSLEAARNELASSQKDRAELDMITDLLRNDLARIEKPESKVIKRYGFLEVPGLLHQYSVIEQRLSDETNWFQIIKSLFPGGSITGAPKNRVIKIIKNIEKSPRGFYTGSTLLDFQDTKSASINIRSSEWSLSKKTGLYGSGGGITLQSEAEDEYQEALVKERSFFELLSESFNN